MLEIATKNTFDINVTKFCNNVIALEEFDDSGNNVTFLDRKWNVASCTFSQGMLYYNFEEWVMDEDESERDKVIIQYSTDSTQTTLGVHILDEEYYYVDVENLSKEKIKKILVSIEETLGAMQDLGIIV